MTPWLALLGWLTSVGWFITDDAFISFRYVRNLLDGHGLVFNPGEYVEGYTNFLWILELAAIWRVLGLRPEDVANWLSVIYTVGTIAVMLWWVARMPWLRHRGLIAWMALGLISSSATFAVWTSGGGLETRQFTFFALVAVVCLSVFGVNRWGLGVASLSLAGAALTRPEGLLVAACCVGWYVGHRALRDRVLDWRGTLALAGPFVVLIGGHFLARYRYYGEWLPNTYYAKHVSSWFESGFRYLWAAAIETGLYLLIPLAYVALRFRWREHRDGTYALVLALVGTHMLYMLEVGGDHFEYRPLDFYWPLLAVPAAEGVARLATRFSDLAHRFSRHLRWAGPRMLAVVLFIPLVFYASAIQAALFFEGDATVKLGHTGYIELDEENAEWLLAAPAMPALVAISNDMRGRSLRHAVGASFAIHRESAAYQLRGWQPYMNAERGVIPTDAVMDARTIGIKSYYAPDLTVIDLLGLTDATIARNPSDISNNERLIAHDRHPPLGYLQRRGVNIRIGGAVETEVRALTKGNYAVRIEQGVWMPFDAADHQWVNEHFAGLELRSRNRFSQSIPEDNHLIIDDVRFVGEEFIGRFDEGLDGWTSDPKAVSNNKDIVYFGLWAPVFGHVGSGFLTTYYPGKWERFGRAYSPTFTPREDQYLAFLIAGERHDDVGMRLLVNGEAVTIWRGDGMANFELVVYPLRQFAGKEVQLEIFNNEIGDRPRLMLDHVMLLRKESPESE